jgi:hypothetical protein
VSGNYATKLIGSIKLSPCGGYNDMYFTSSESLLETFKYYIKELDALNIAWMQITQYNAYGDAKLDGKPQGYDHDVVATYGPLIKNSNLLANCGYTSESGEAELKNKERNVKVRLTDYIELTIREWFMEVLGSPIQIFTCDSKRNWS